MKQVIINADDFGYSKGINRGILYAIKNGVVSSTSVMVYGNAANEAIKLKDIEKISVGLHLHIESTDNPQKEFDKQVEMFIKLVGRAPDHIDVHKPRSSDMTLIKPILEEYSEKHTIPVRELGYAHSIKTFFGIDVKNSDNDIDPERVSVENLLSILENLDDGVSEIMTHVGYSDDELRGMSSYHDMRELELKTLTDKKVIEYFKKTQNRELVNWNIFKDK